MVLVIEREPVIAICMQAVYRIMVAGEEVHELLGRTTEEQQYRKPCRKNYMSKPFYHLKFAPIKRRRKDKAYKRSTMKKLVSAILIILLTTPAFAQTRISDPNTIAWFNSFNTIYLKKNISLWLEYQWRREGPVQNWQQSLARGGVQYHFKNGMSAMAGYGYIITYPYGDYPAGPYSFPEHRIFEQLVWNSEIGRVQLSHRLRLEQRFLGRIDQKAPEYTLQEWVYLNRARYQVRATVPLNHKKMQDKTWYIAAFDEIFIGFGKNVNQNVFDQNRISALVGYQYNRSVRVDAGWFNQTLQQPALVDGKQVYQYNNGFSLNLYLTKW
jgi:hypothetical protein